MIRRRKATPREYAVAGGLFVLLIWLMFLFWGIFQKEEVARHAAADAKQQLAALSAREATLQANIDDLHTDRGQEASIRETYGVAKPGEEVIIVVPPEEGETVPKDPWWKIVISWFGFR